MSSKKKNKLEEKDIMISSVIEKRKNDSRLIYILVTIIVLLSLLLIYYMFFKDDRKELECSSVSIKEVEVDPKHQFINYQGFKFRMPLDWDFVNNSNKYEISNKDENLFIDLEYLDVSYDEFISSTYQKFFLEGIQTAGDIKIEKSAENKKSDVNYYLMEGTYNDYNYMIVAVGNDDKVILVNSQFIDKVSFDKLKKSVIDFSISSLK